MDYVPHVVAWNLTKRCNLECAHCYISAGPSESAAAELDTADCLAIVDQLLAVNPAPLLILSGGEPLLRRDLGEIAHYASANGATVVVGTNGTLLTDERIAVLTDAGVRGVAVSVDSLRPSYHDNFRRGRGALADVQAALARLRAARLDFIVQTTVTRGNRAELGALVAWSADQGAVSFNCYFLVPTGRGAGLSDLSPADYEAVLTDLARWEHAYRGRMLVRAKCAPHFMRLVHQTDPESPVLNYETRCPCGTQYCRITPAKNRRRWPAISSRSSSPTCGSRRPCSAACARAHCRGSAAHASTARCAAAAGRAGSRSRGTCSPPIRRAVMSRRATRPPSSRPARCATAATFNRRSRGRPRRASGWRGSPRSCAGW